MRVHLWLAAIVAIAAVGLLSSADVGRAHHPDKVHAGYDLFETESAELGFGQPNPPPYPDSPTLPADLFGPGSDPFTGTVEFKGVPIGAFGAFSGLGSTDTIVQRLQPDAEPPFPDTIDIEIVRLELVSVAPITVTYNGGQNPEDWDMTAQVPEGDANQTPGTMTIDHEYPDGGTFSSTLPVDPLMTFTKVGGGGQVGPFHLSDVGFPVFDLLTTGAPKWCHTAGPLVLEKPGLTGPNFYPGVDCPGGPATEIITLVDELHQPPWGGSNHRVRPVVTPVGGTTELFIDGSVSPASSATGSGSSAPLYAALAGVAAAVAMMGAGGWYARRRWLR